MERREWRIEAVSDAEAAREIIRHREEDGCPCGLRAAYEDYLASAPWIPFERFELGVHVLAEGSDG